jgi:hypothetical protein
MSTPELDLFNPVTIPPAGAPCEWCREPGATQLVAVTPPKVVTRGENRGDVKAHGTMVRVCGPCGERLDAKLEERRQAEEEARERKNAARRKAAAERKAARR